MVKLSASTWKISKLHRSLLILIHPNKNGALERDNRIVMEAVESMLYSAQVHLRFWGEAVHTAVYTLNRSASETSHAAIVNPFEAWHKRRPSAHMRIFGIDAYVHTPAQVRKKLNPKAKKGIMIGYSTSSKAYRIWSNTIQQIIESRDVMFDEDQMLPGFIDYTEQPQESVVLFSLQGVAMSARATNPSSNPVSTFFFW